jgi:hypothetical protein
VLRETDAWVLVDGVPVPAASQTGEPLAAGDVIRAR